jgi:uncharacterized membrane protein YfcA
MALTSIDLQYVVSGLLVGLLVGQTGVGGGSLMTPLLILLFGMHPATAVGTDLLQASLTKTAGSLVHGFNRTVNWRLVARLAAGSLPATAVTLFIASRYDLLDRHSEALLAVTLGLVLIITAASLLLRESILTKLSGRISPMSERRTALLTVVTGLVIGVLVSLTSIGAGAIGVTAMLLLYPKLPTRVIVGSDIAHAVPLTLLAGIGHLIMGSVDLHLMTVLLLGSVPGVVIGSTLAAKLPEWVVRPVLALVLIVVGVRLVV